MIQPARSRSPIDNSAIPNMIFVLIVLNGLAFALSELSGPLRELMLYPLGHPRFAPWQLVTHAFLHNGLAHIAFNMFALWMFGRDIERLMGERRFLVYYMTCVLGSALAFLTMAALVGSRFPAVGASGGVFGIMLAYGLAFPNRTVMMLIPPVPLPARVWLLVIGGMQVYIALSSGLAALGVFGHLGGMLSGYVLLQYWSKARRR